MWHIVNKHGLSKTRKTFTVNIIVLKIILKSFKKFLLKKI